MGAGLLAERSGEAFLEPRFVVGEGRRLLRVPRVEVVCLRLTGDAQIRVIDGKDGEARLPRQGVGRRLGDDVPGPAAAEERGGGGDQGAEGDERPAIHAISSRRSAREAKPQV